MMTIDNKFTFPMHLMALLGQKHDHRLEQRAAGQHGHPGVHPDGQN